MGLSASGLRFRRAGATLPRPPSSAVASEAPRCGWSGRRTAPEPRPSGEPVWTPYGQGLVCTAAWLTLTDMRTWKGMDSPAPGKAACGPRLCCRGQGGAGLAPKLGVPSVNWDTESH